MCKVTFIYLGLKNVHHRCWGLGELLFVLTQQFTFVCFVLFNRWCFSLEEFHWRTGEHKDYLGPYFIRPFANALAAQCPNLTQWL